jgi:hypothetical protein
LSNSLPDLEALSLESSSFKIPFCEIHTNNPYYEHSGTNADLPEAAIFTRLRQSEWICKKCMGGYVESLDRLTCTKPNNIINCKAYSTIECNNCKSSFTKNKNYYIKSSFKEELQFDLKNFYQNFSQFSHPFILNDPSKPFFINRQFNECQSYDFIPNCKEEYYSGICKLCDNGYFLSSDFKCIKNPLEKITNCKDYLSENSCLKCFKNFHLIKYSTILVSNQSIDLMKCVPIQSSNSISNCEQYEVFNSVTYCSLCKADYYLDTSSQDTIQGVILASSCTKRQQSLLIGGCYKYSPYQDQCEDCIYGLGISQDKLKCFSQIDDCLVYNYNQDGSIFDSQSNS